MLAEEAGGLGFRCGLIWAGHGGSDGRRNRLHLDGALSRPRLEEPGLKWFITGGAGTFVLQ